MRLLSRTKAADAAEIVPGLRIGSLPSKGQVQSLLDAGVTCVVDLRAESSGANHWPESVEMIRLSLIDHGTPTVGQLREAAGVVQSAVASGHEVYMHCYAGQERAPTVACAFLLLQGWTMAEAYSRVTAARPSASPTEGQLQALRTMDEALSKQRPEARTTT